MARRGGSKRNALVAAATNIRLSEPKLAEKQAAKRQDWQAEAWAYYDTVPEVKESIRYRGNQMGKLHLFTAVENPNDPAGPPVPANDPESGVPPSVAEQADLELGRLQSSVGGQAEILRETDMNLEVVGECYLVGRGERTVEVPQRDGTIQVSTMPEDWQIRSISEIDVRRGEYFVKDDPGNSKGARLDPDLDSIIRIWTRHPQWSNLPDSSMRALLEECRTLQVLTQQVQAEANSRQSAGMFTVPNELSFGGPDPTQPIDGQDDDDPDPFQQELQRALTEPIGDPSSASSVMPMLVRGPAQYLTGDFMRHIDFGRDTSESMEKRIQARIERIARGLNLPVEKVMGHQQTTFANAAQVDLDEYNDYLQPAAETATDALTYAFLMPQLAINPSVPPEWADGRLFIAADPSALITPPSKQENANDAFDRNTISADTYRASTGYNEADAPDPLELLARTGLRRGIMTGDITIALLELMGIDLGVAEKAAERIQAQTEAEVAAEAVALPPADEDEEEVEAVVEAARAAILEVLASIPPPAVVVEPAPMAELTAAPVVANPLGRQLMEIDRELRTRLVIAANDAMTRALDRAASRLRSKANGTELRATLRDVPKPQMFAHLGATLVAQVLGDDDPLAGAWDELEDQFRVWGGQAQKDAIESASRFAGGFSTAQRADFGLRQAQDIDEAWGWMAEALDGLAVERMFDPNPAAPAFGEFDPTLKVPSGLIRQAMARAGGNSGLQAGDKGQAFVTVADAGTRPAGGVATGELVKGALQDEGVVTESYRWVYGLAQRQQNFQPHLDLARNGGVVFEHFDDPQLKRQAGTTFPPYEYYFPGDHTGCICDFEPIIPGVEGVAPVAPAAPSAPPLVSAPPPGRPLAEGFTLSKKAKASGLDDMVERIGQIHGLPDDDLRPTNIVWARNKGGRKGGHFTPAKKPAKVKKLKSETPREYAERVNRIMEAPRDPELRVIDRVEMPVMERKPYPSGEGSRVTRNVAETIPDSPEFSFLHEVGHRIDFDVTTRDYVTNRYQPTGDVGAALEKFRGAVEESGIIGELRENHVPDGWRTYALQKHEVWARAYSQWMGDKLGVSGAGNLRKKDIGFQWPDETFGPVGEAVEGVLRARGLMR